MENKVINVQGMSCDHCVKAITNALTALDGVNKVEVSLENNTVSVEFNTDVVALNQIQEAIEDQGYDVI